jgi:hypothetical protein
MITPRRPARRGSGRRPVMRDEVYDPTVNELHVGHRPSETLPLNQHLHELWQVLGLDDEDENEDENKEQISNTE